MSKTAVPTIESLLQSGAWDVARMRIEQELLRQPDDHWLLTQRGVVDYEQGRYRESLPHFMAALEIVPDCPLTLWNVAGALDSLGKPEAALPIYTWLLRTKNSVADDPCWESAEWTDSLKTDCVYRVGVCFRHMNQADSAENCFRQYINLILAGTKGTYSIQDAALHIREIHGKNQAHTDKEVREAFRSTLQDAGMQSLRGGKSRLPKLSLPELLAR